MYLFPGSGAAPLYIFVTVLFLCRTKAQIQHEEYVAKREAAALKKAGVKSHRQRISEYNEKLSLMTEHNDIPKVGPG